MFHALEASFEMKRREIFRLALAIVLPMVPGIAKANSGKSSSELRYKVFTGIRAGRDVPPGNLPPDKESLKWMANSATLIYGEREAVLVDTFMTVEQCSNLADIIVASGKSLKAIYVTHGHPDHFFGLQVLLDRFPNAKALATPEVVAKWRFKSNRRYWPTGVNSSRVFQTLFPSRVRWKVMRLTWKETD
jgi:glyoxylase-like metal-dependent hydrolase (beta-lactamase superfamily II)